MLSKQWLKLVLLISLFTPVLATCYADAAEKPITLAILPCDDPVKTLTKFNKLTAYMKEHSGRDVNIIVPTDIETIRSSLQNGEIDFILQDPHTYVQLAGLLSTDSILSVLAWDGANTQRGLIIVREDSGIKEVGDLRGKSVMFGPKLSITKWVAARALLKENGVRIDRDLKGYSHGRCCEDIAFHVFLKSVDAGALCDDFFEEQTEGKTSLGIDLKQMRVIGRTSVFPTRVFAARKGMDREILHQINEALLSLDAENPEHAGILGPAKVGGFRMAKDQDYESLRALIVENPL